MSRCPLPGLVLASILGGCSGPALFDTHVCDPPCPATFTCSADGCLPPDRPTDLSPAPAGDLRAGCDPACGGATPLCNAHGICVACLSDDDCPAASVCRILGIGSLCVPGCREDAQCRGAGGSPTASCCAGQCVETASDTSSCGACGRSCLRDHRGATCMAGACVEGRCQDGWGDCDLDEGNGCEAALHHDLANCGRCGVTCQPDHAVGACAGACYLAACEFGFDDCDGSEANGCEAAVLGDPANCGGCGRACPTLPHTAASCSAGVCQLTCSPGFDDCNGDAADGCEVSVSGDTSNCGACATTCDQGLVCRAGRCTCPDCVFPNASSTCVNNRCAIDRCLAGFANCNQLEQDGCEASLLDDPANCGACGNECPVQMPGCDEGACVERPRSIPGFQGELGPDYSSDGWIQCLGVLDRAGVDDLPQIGWSQPCIDKRFLKLRLACGADANTVEFIDVSRDVFATDLMSNPEEGLIENASFALPDNQIYSSGFDMFKSINVSTSHWVTGDGCPSEKHKNLIINSEACLTWDVTNCFGQGLMGDRYFYVYVRE